MKKLLKKIRDYEVMTDRMEHEISQYLMKVTTRGTWSDASMQKVTSLFSAINDLERIGDLFFQMSRDVERILKSEKSFRNKQLKNLQNMTDDEDTETTTLVIDGLVKRIREHFLESLDVLTAKETFLVEDNGDNRSRLNILEHLDRIMADKKMHEVVVLARALQNIAGRAIQVSSSSNDEPF